MAGRRPALLRRRRPPDQTARGTALVKVIDLSSAPAAAELVQTASEAFGGVDVLVKQRRRDQNPPARRLPRGTSLDLHVATNIRAPFLLNPGRAPVAPSVAGGVVVNISSSSGTIVPPGAIGLRHDQRRRSSTSPARSRRSWRAIESASTASRPGRSTTRRFTRRGPIAARLRRRTLPQVPLARIASPDEIAAWIAFLCGTSRAG